MVKYTLALFLLIAICSCGKKAKNSDSSGPDRKPTDTISDPTRFILSQNVYCSDVFDCPEAVAKLVVMDRGGVRYCTGSLISANKMVTAASCLPRALQVKDLDCTSSIYALFPKTLFFGSELARCRKIVYSDYHENEDPALWRQDLAIIELVRPTLRSPFLVSSEGMKEGTPLESLQMSYQTEYNGVINKKNCSPIFNSYANPFSTKSDSPMISTGNCYLEEGNQGSPLLNARGELVGILGANLDRNISNYLQQSGLLGEKMSGISHASNLACATEVINPAVKSLECERPISISLLDDLRYRLLQNKTLHESRMQKILVDLEKPEKYFKYDFYFKYNYEKDFFEIDMEKPKCFFDINNWIYEFSRWGGRVRTYAVLNYEIPRYRFKTKLNKYLQVYSEQTMLTNKKFKVEFNPKDASRYGNTYVSISSTDESGEFLPRADYSEITSSCQ